MTIRRTTYFMQICERGIATLHHANSLFLVIYEVFFTGHVAQGFCAKSVDSLDLVSHVTFWLASKVSLGSCMPVWASPEERMSSTAFSSSSLFFCTSVTVRSN